MAGKEKTTGEVEQERHAEVVAALGEPDPVPEPEKVKADKRTAIEIERDEQAAVEKALRNVTIVEGKP